MIGLLGGAFDPPHNGHVALADAAERQLGLDGIVVVVVADPGHKEVHLPGGDEARLARARVPRAARSCSTITPRTVDMLREGRWDDPVLLIGADEFLDFGAGRSRSEVLELARLGVATRPGYAVAGGRPDRSRPLLRESSPCPSPRARSGRRSPAASRSTASSRPAVAAAIAGRGPLPRLD